MLEDIQLIVDDSGLIRTNIPVFSDENLKLALKGFLKESAKNKRKYLQAEFNMAFDGYSFMGQEDSLNQYDTDLLHSFVLSTMSPTEKFPKQFHAYLKTEFVGQLEFIQMLEKAVLKTFGLTQLEQFYRPNMTHMVSCNYYPKLDFTREEPQKELRLSFHKDVSLFSVFLFGLAPGFAYEDKNGQLKTLGAIDHIVLFPGYFIEMATDGKIKALSHGVNLPEKRDEERHSFAFFSIPKATSEINFNAFQGSGKAYFQKYLSLF